MAEPVKVTDQNFDEEVLQAELPVLVDFYADWCGPCRTIAPIVAEIATEQDGKLKVCKVDVTQSVETASRYGVMSIPTLMVFKAGEEVEKVVGALSREQLMAKLTPVLG